MIYTLNEDQKKRMDLAQKAFKNYPFLKNKIVKSGTYGPTHVGYEPYGCAHLVTFHESESLDQTNFIVALQRLLDVGAKEGEDFEITVDGGFMGRFENLFITPEASEVARECGEEVLNSLDGYCLLDEDFYYEMRYNIVYKWLDEGDFPDENEERMLELHSRAGELTDEEYSEYFNAISEAATWVGEGSFLKEDMLEEYGDKYGQAINMM